MAQNKPGTVRSARIQKGMDRLRRTGYSGWVWIEKKEEGRKIRKHIKTKSFIVYIRLHKSQSKKFFEKHCLVS